VASQLRHFEAQRGEVSCSKGSVAQLSANSQLAKKTLEETTQLRRFIRPPGKQIQAYLQDCGRSREGLLNPKPKKEKKETRNQKASNALRNRQLGRTTKAGWRTKSCLTGEQKYCICAGKPQHRHNTQTQTAPSPQGGRAGAACERSAGVEKARRNDQTPSFHPATGEADTSISQDMRIYLQDGGRV
jgi:hypothetical protein